MEKRFVGTVDEIIKRKVRAFLSRVSLNPDLAVEVFVLERDHADQAPEGLGWQEPARISSASSTPHPNPGSPRGQRSPRQADG